MHGGGVLLGSGVSDGGGPVVLVDVGGRGVRLGVRVGDGPEVAVRVGVRDGPTVRVAVRVGVGG